MDVEMIVAAGVEMGTAALSTGEMRGAVTTQVMAGMPPPRVKRETEARGQQMSVAYE